MIFPERDVWRLSPFSLSHDMPKAGHARQKKNSAHRQLRSREAQLYMYRHHKNRLSHTMLLDVRNVSGFILYIQK